MEHKRAGLDAQKSYFFVYYYLLAGIILLIAAFLFVEPASAQTVDSFGVESFDVVLDESVTAEDLDVSESLVLPDSFFYGFKRFGRGVREFITFNPVKKAEIRLDHANQELADAQQLLEEKANDPDAVEAVAEAIERFEERIGKITEKIEDLQEKKQEGDVNIDRFLDNVLDKQIKHQKVLERIEKNIFDKAPAHLVENILERIKNARNNTAEDIGEILTEVEDNEDAFVERFDRIFEGQRGSEFKNLRNLEILQGLEDRVPEEALSAIHRAEENAFKRFGIEVKEVPEGERSKRFEEYIIGMGGDETRHMEIFDKLEQVDGLSPEILEKIEVAKDIAARRFQQKVENVNERFDENFRIRIKEQSFSRLKDVDVGVEKLRVLDEFNQRISFDDNELRIKIEAKYSRGVKEFASQFTESNSEVDLARFEALSEQMASNPDAVTFRLLHELEIEVKVDPKKHVFIKNIDQKAKQNFIDRADEEGEDFFEHIASNNPQDIEIFQTLKREFEENPALFFDGPLPLVEGDVPPGVESTLITQYGFLPSRFENFFEKVIELQSEKLSKHLDDIAGTEEFDHFKRKFEAVPPQVLEELRARENFDIIFRDNRQFIQSLELEEDGEEFRFELEKEQVEFEREIFHEEGERFERKVEFEGAVLKPIPLIQDLPEPIREEIRDGFEDQREDQKKLDEYRLELEKKALDRREEDLKEIEFETIELKTDIDHDREESEPLSYILLKTIAKIFLT